MTEASSAVLALLVLGWVVVSGPLVRMNITSPLLFTIAGYVLANPDWGVVTIDIDTPSAHLVTELTLALLLFSDAARVNLTSLRHDAGVPGRLLGIGLPLSLVLGALAAAWLLDDLSWALACFVAASVAPTDAALSAQVVNDERIPMRLRRALNVESGLNDGIVTPIVAFTLVVAADELGVSHHDSAETSALLELALGVGVGVAIGLVSAALISVGSRRHWIVPGARRIGILAASLGSFAVALALDGNGFLAAFVAGIVFGARVDKDVVAVDDAIELPELVGETLTLVVWFLFGAALVPLVLTHFAWATAAVRTPEPDRPADDSGGARSGGLGPGQTERPLRGLVRPARPCLDRLCPPGGGGARRERRGRQGRGSGRA